MNSFFPLLNLIFFPISSLNNFVFEGCRISALVGTTKYPQDVDLDRIAANAALEPIPPISMNPRFPRPSWVGRQQQQQLQFSIPSNISFSRHPVPCFPSSELDDVIVSEDTSLESQVLSYKDDDTPRMMSLLYPDYASSASSPSRQFERAFPDMVVGTGGLVNDVWSDAAKDSANLSPRSVSGDDENDNGCSSLRYAFVPRLDFSALQTEDSCSSGLVNGRPPCLTLPLRAPVMSPPQGRGNTPLVSLKSPPSELMESPRGIDDLDSLEPMDLEGRHNLSTCFDMEKAVSAAAWIPTMQRSVQPKISPVKSPRMSTADMIAEAWQRTSDQMDASDSDHSFSYSSVPSSSYGAGTAPQYNMLHPAKPHGGGVANISRAGAQKNEYSFPQGVQNTPFKPSEDVIRCPIAPNVSFTHLQQELLLTQQLQQQQQLLLQQAQWMMSAFSQLQFQQQQMSTGTNPNQCLPLGMNVCMNFPVGYSPAGAPFAPNQCTSLLGQNTNVCS